MSPDPGLLVLNRLHFMRQAAASGHLAQRAPAVPLSIEDIFRRYRGFDGVAWPSEGHPPLRDEDGLIDARLLEDTKRYRRELPSPEEHDLLMLVRHCEDRGPPSFPGWQFVGFDVGYFESPYSHFSVVLNEVIWGVIDELRSFGSRLNRDLLLDDVRDALELTARHEMLARQGADVEADGVFPIAVYVRDEGDLR